MGLMKDLLLYKPEYFWPILHDDPLTFVCSESYIWRFENKYK